ncbi:MAG: fatty acid desaturase [Planctomycetales bacterium]
MAANLVSPTTPDTCQPEFDSTAIYDPARLRGNIPAWAKGTLVFVLIHAGCFAAPFFFSWSALGAAAALYVLTGCVGITFCYHRYLSHRSFKLVKPVEFLALLCGALAGQGSPLKWITWHRMHHAHSDEKGDPHSPLVGVWWSHMFWLFTPVTNEEHQALHRKYAPDLVDRPMIQFFERVFGGANSHLIQVAVLYAIGGLPLLVWGGCVRMTLVLHSTWFVNSATHLWGYRNYETRDESRNLWWVAVLTFGEGWHNNHHAHPRLAPSGHRWWELDPTWWLIKTLRFLGLAYDVEDRMPPQVEKPSRAAASPKRELHQSNAA